MDARGGRRWTGILLVLTGVILIAYPALTSLQVWGGGAQTERLPAGDSLVESSPTAASSPAPSYHGGDNNDTRRADLAAGAARDQSTTYPFFGADDYLDPNITVNPAITGDAGADRGEGTGVTRETGHDVPVKFLARDLRLRLREGDQLGTLKIPAMNLETTLYHGTVDRVLKFGPGHYQKTRLPGEGSNTAIAGHRTTYGAPFFRLNRLSEGDIILIELAYGAFRYRVTESRIVSPTDIYVLDDRGGDTLTLTTCHPIWSDRYRLVVYADLADAVR